MSALRELGGAFGLGLSPVIGVALHDDGLVLSRVTVKKKKTELERLLFWRFDIPRELHKDDIKALSKQVISATSAVRGELTDIALALPTRYLSLGSVQAEYQEPKLLKQELTANKFDFYAEVDEEYTPSFPDTPLFFDEVIENNKKLDYFHARLAWLDEDAVLPYIRLLRQSGLNPTVLDVEIFAAANFFIYQFDKKARKDLFLKPTVFCEINKNDAFLLFVRKDRWEIVELDIHNSDKILLEQAEKQDHVDYDGFWGELFERVSEDIKLELETIAQWNGETSIEHLVMFSNFTNVEKFAQYLKTRQELPAQALQLPSNFTTSEQSAKYFDSEPVYSRFISCFGVSLRTMNPFLVKEPPNEYFKLNFLPEWQDIADTRVNRSMLNGVTRTLVFSFLGILAYAGWTGFQIYSQAPSEGLTRLTKEVEQAERQINNVKVQLVAEQGQLTELSPDQRGAKQIKTLLNQIAEQLPKDALLESLKVETKDKKMVATLQGVALSDNGIIVLEQNIKRSLNRAFNIKSKPQVERSVVEGEPLKYTWELEVK